MTSETKSCSKCGDVKSLSEFYQSTGWRDGYYSWCKACHRSLTKMRIKSLGPRERRIDRVRSLYQISHPAAAALVDARRCQICGIEPEKLEIDHCHVTGKVRGTLCRRCNKGIGFFDSQPDWLIKATAYVWPLPVGDFSPRVDVTRGATEPGLWADGPPGDDDLVSHGEWSS